MRHRHIRVAVSENCGQQRTVDAAPEIQSERPCSRIAIRDKLLSKKYHTLSRLRHAVYDTVCNFAFPFILVEFHERLHREVAEYPFDAPGRQAKPLATCEQIRRRRLWHYRQRDGNSACARRDGIGPNEHQTPFAIDKARSSEAGVAAVVIRDGIWHDSAYRPLKRPLKRRPVDLGRMVGCMEEFRRRKRPAHDAQSAERTTRRKVTDVQRRVLHGFGLCIRKRHLLGVVKIDSKAAVVVDKRDVHPPVVVGRRSIEYAGVGVAGRLNTPLPSILYRGHKIDRRRRSIVGISGVKRKNVHIP